jgi:hypothetical protein
MATLALSNISLSNLLTATGANILSPLCASNLYSVSNVSSLPTQNQPLRFGFFRGLSIVTSGCVYYLQASSLILTNGEAVSSWGNFTQTVSTKKPTYNCLGAFPFVSFSGTTIEQALKWTTTKSVDFSGGGGSTYVLVCRVPQYVTYHRAMAHFGPNTSSTHEWILLENDGRLHHPLYYLISNKTPSLTLAQAPTNTWMVLVSRYTNSTMTSSIFKNGTQTSTASSVGTIQNATITSFSVGGQGDNAIVNNKIDIFHAAMYARPLTDTEISNIWLDFQYVTM